MERNQLLYVVEVAQQGNITKAAEVLHITQPSLSVQIMNLEQELGVSLFERTRKRVYLTEAGKVFVEKAILILNQIESLKRTMEDFSARRKGALRIGVLPVMLPLHLHELLAAFSDAFPDLELRLIELGSSELIHKVLDDQLDAAFVIRSQINEKDEKLKGECLMKSRWMAVIHKNHPLADHSVLNLEDLRDQRLILPSDGFNLQRVLHSRLDYFKIPYKISMTYTQIEACFAFADQQFGIGICSEDLVSYYKYPNIVYVPIHEMPLREIHFIYKKEPSCHPTLESFIEFVHTWFHNS